MLEFIKKNKKIILSSSIFTGINSNIYCGCKNISGKGDESNNQKKETNKKTETPENDTLKNKKDALKNLLKKINEENNKLKDEYKEKITIDDKLIDSKTKDEELTEIENNLNKISTNINNKLKDKAKLKEKGDENPPKDDTLKVEKENLKQLLSEIKQKNEELGGDKEDIKIDDNFIDNKTKKEELNVVSNDLNIYKNTIEEKLKKREKYKNGLDLIKEYNLKARFDKDDKYIYIFTDKDGKYKDIQKSDSTFSEEFNLENLKKTKFSFPSFKNFDFEVIFDNLNKYKSFIGITENILPILYELFGESLIFFNPDNTSVASLNINNPIIVIDLITGRKFYYSRNETEYILFNSSSTEIKTSEYYYSFTKKKFGKFKANGENNDADFNETEGVSFKEEFKKESDKFLNPPKA